MSDAEKAALKALREIVAMLDSVGDFTLGPATRFGETDDVVEVEFAKGWSTSCATRASVAKMLPRWKRDHPDAHFHKTPKVTESPSLARRKAIAEKRRRWLDLHSAHADTLRRLLAEHGIDAGWPSGYSTTWRRQVSCATNDLTDDKVAAWMVHRSVECSGARDRLHINTEQAGRVDAARYGQQIDGLEAALWCDYACSTCQADARRMVKALEAQLEQADKARAKRKKRAADTRLRVDEDQVANKDCMSYRRVFEQMKHDGINLAEITIRRTIDELALPLVWRGQKKYGIRKADAPPLLRRLEEKQSSRK